jgi:putative NIF3 family GTP cyclohydrolase 1 type 2
MNVREAVDAILTACAVEPISNTCDRLIAGRWEAEVTGIATTFMATPAVIREAAARGANLILTHEPTFFTHADGLDWLQNDEVYRRKQALIAETGMNIWRFHDHIHSMTPDLIFAGVLRDLGWESARALVPGNPFLYQIPPTSVSALAALLKERLGVEMVRVVGNLEARVEKVGLLIGGGSLGLGSDTMPMELIREHDLDVIVAGEILEWTLCAYVRDAAQLGLSRALIVAGHNRTEEAGMKHLPEWLATVLPGVRAFFVEAGDPYVYW